VTDLVKTSGLSLLVELERTGAITRTSLTLPPDVTYDQYEALFTMLGDIRDSACWLIGDLINYGEKVYGHTYAQAVHLTGLNEHTLANYAWVCSNIPRSRRREPSKLRFSVHSEVAFLPPSEQEHWLKLAEKNGWKRARMREALAPLRDGPTAPMKEIEASSGDENLPPAGPLVHICQCPACGRYHRSDEDVKQ
jgi:hypothetical protein